MLKREKLNLIEALKSVHWSPSAETSPLFSQHGISHGVLGRSIPEFKLAELLPHHVTQIHGSDLVIASEKTAYKSEERPVADAICTSSGMTVAIKTADCLPILLATKDGHWVAAIHSGWRGFTKGIIGKTVEAAMIANPDRELIAVVGPSISRERFEVGPEVIEALNSQECGLSTSGVHLATAKGNLDRWHVDLGLAAACQLLEIGVQPANIEVLQSCTFMETIGQHHRWHSYRRDGKACGSNWTWIRGR
jgi:YfiH family protein